MKTIGLLGGMSWESTADYYKAINEGVKEALGGLHSAQIVLYSMDFEPIEQLQHAGDWAALADRLSQAARCVQSAGADFLVLCTNTMHRVAPEIEQATDIPLLHIADATARVLVADGVRKVGLLGTAFTMEQDFYKERLIRNHGLEVIVPGATDRKLIHDVIYRELCLGRIVDDSRRRYLHIIDKLAREGADAVILGCTEIGMLVKQTDTAVKLYDTTAIHALSVVEAALQVSPARNHAGKFS
ncbi:MAG: aspartate/glutamate racemase family protein [Arenicellales bacterium]|jgi:aspartate racemase